MGPGGKAMMAKGMMPCMAKGLMALMGQKGGKMAGMMGKLMGKDMNALMGVCTPGPDGKVGRSDYIKFHIHRTLHAKAKELGDKELWHLGQFPFQKQDSELLRLLAGGTLEDSGESTDPFPGWDEASSLVDEVKELQKTDQDFNAAWWEHCDKNGKGVRDPWKHPTDFLKSFLSQYKANLAAGVIKKSSSSSQGGSRASPDTVEKLKQLQRTDPEAKQLWWRYCNSQGGGNKDPTIHEASFVERFLERYQAGDVVSLATGGSGERGAKRMRTGDAWSMPMAMPMMPGFGW